MATHDQTGFPHSSARDEDLRDALVQTSYAVIDVIATTAARNSVSLTLLRVLAILRDRTPAMSELAAHLGLDKSTITGLIHRAADRGLIRKFDDERDGRSSRVALTDAGRDLAERCTAEVTRGLDPFFAGLSTEQRDQLSGLLNALGAVHDERR
ncbi:MAG: MarR family transcriptional regulator [Arachnia sp.]